MPTPTCPSRQTLRARAGMADSSAIANVRIDMVNTVSIFTGVGFRNLSLVVEDVWYIGLEWLQTAIYRIHMNTIGGCGKQSEQILHPSGLHAFRQGLDISGGVVQNRPPKCRRWSFDDVLHIESVDMTNKSISFPYWDFAMAAPMRIYVMLHSRKRRDGGVRAGTMSTADCHACCKAL